MTTISIKNGKEFSNRFIDEINQRENEVLSKKVKTISWSEVSLKLNNMLLPNDKNLF